MEGNQSTSSEHLSHSVYEKEIEISLPSENEARPSENEALPSENDALPDTAKQSMIEL